MKNAAASIENPAKSTAQKRIDALKARAWDGWIFASADLRRIFLAPPAPNDAEIASALGLALASSTSGLHLIHRGHEVEET